MKILFINPNFKYFPGLLENFLEYKSPPLGLAYLASYIRKKHSVSIEICDAAALNLDERAVADRIKEFRPDVIGITVTTTTVEYVRNVFRLAKQLSPDVVVVLGGPHVSALPSECLDFADVSVIGEGEDTFLELVESLLNRISFEGIKGVAFKKNGVCVVNERRPLIDDLNKLPFPARDLLPKYAFKHIYPYRLDNPYYDTLITSRGCVYDCSFCVSKLIWNGETRCRSLDNVFLEIDELVNKYNRSLLFIRDDNFLLNAGRVVDFCQRKRKYFPKLKWMCHGRADCLSAPLLEEMQGSGCLEIQIGVESGDDDVLRKCRKMVSTDAIVHAFGMLKKTRINSWATFIIGNEGETEESVNKTIEFAKKISPTYCSFMFLSPLPGSKCFKDMSQKGYIKTFDWSKYSWHGEPVFSTEHLSKKMLEELRKKAYRSFYLRPSKLLEYFFVMIKEREFGVVFVNTLILIKFLFGLIKK